jgi:hypothetical protein
VVPVSVFPAKLWFSLWSLHAASVFSRSGGSLREVVAHWEKWWLIGRSGGSLGEVVAHWEKWWLIGRSGGSLAEVVSRREKWWLTERSGDSSGEVVTMSPAYSELPVIRWATIWFGNLQ